jgi:hypothetical protein
MGRYVVVSLAYFEITLIYFFFNNQVVIFSMFTRSWLAITNGKLLLMMQNKDEVHD